ncbi:MAG: ATP-binding cassette domain-containing protein [Chitinispirillaceae bacterium]|nr:ATP-binding cassette domain-containing protein [Chitinispirillaceae bacterium]
MRERLFNVSISTSEGRNIVKTDAFPIYENCITFLFGESGIGKSLISKAIYGVFVNTDLQIEIDGKPYGRHLSDSWTKNVKKNSFFVFQEPSSHLNPLLTLKEQLNEGSLADRDESDIVKVLWHSLSDEKREKLLSIYPKTYRPSGGEKQRVLLAMAFKRINSWIENKELNEPTFFVFDEPTGSLDNAYRNLFLKMLFQKFANKPFTVMIITHDYSIISEVYEKYSEFIPFIKLKELSRIQENEVVVNDFSAEEYLSWIKEKQNTSKKKELISEAVLEIKPEFFIFGRRLGIFSDPSYKNMIPLTINKGEMVYVKAPSGVGKTTLAKIIMGIYKPTSFSMKLGNININEKTPLSVWKSQIWGKKVGMVFQHADESLNLLSTVFETFKGLPLGKRISKNEIISYLKALFDEEITDSFLNKKVLRLSGGQKQRLNLLRTLILKNELVILDEPLNGLDFVSVKKVLNLLEKKLEEGVALLMISHNEEIFEHCVSQENIYYLKEL